MGNGYTMRKVGDVLIRQTAPRQVLMTETSPFATAAPAIPNLKLQFG